MINIQVRSEVGEVVARGISRLDWSSTVYHIDRNRFPFLGSLIPAGDTMFNSLQAKMLRGELGDQSVKEIIGPSVAAEIENLCVRVEKGMHLYLWFIGD